MLLDTYNNYLISEPEVTESWLSGASVAVIILVAFLALIALGLVILVLIANCKIFKKAGEAWWKGLIPLYNSWVETKITGLGWWWFLIFIIITGLFSYMEETNFVVYMALVLTSFNYNFNLAKKFGKTNGFAVFNTIFPVIGLPILAFGSAKYDKDAKVDENGIFSIKK
ncbi:MAG: hypothetical protein J6X28_01790 [Bacilli bacterium]|nr:hypothetical protein [Bacilli bacterium]